MRAQLLAALRARARPHRRCCGLAYPLAVTGVAQVAFGDEADGSLVERDGEVVGSDAARPGVHRRRVLPRPARRPPAARPRARRSTSLDDDGEPTGETDAGRPDDLSTAASGASNLGPTNEDLLADRRGAGRRLPRATTASRRRRRVPVDAVTASGSGLDPHISVANARLQAAAGGRRAGASTVDDVLDLVDDHTDRPAARVPRRGRASTSSSSTSPSTSSTLSGGVRCDAWHGARCASTSAPRRASARPSPCSTRAGAGAERGTDVVVGFVETHGRARTAEQIGDLEVVPRRPLDVPGRDVRGDGPRRRPRPPARGGPRRRAGPHQRPRLAATRSAGRTSRSCSTPASTSSRPSTSSTSSRSTTSSSASPASRQRETIPDDVVRAADQIELVDMTPEALRRRMAHGNIYARREDRRRPRPTTSGPATSAALRELALLWVADRVDDALEDYRERHGITEPWETRERVVVAVTGAPGGEHLIRRAARIAQRAHGELLGVHVRSRRRAGRRRRRRCSTSTAGCSRSSAASTTRSPAATSPPRSSTSPGPRTPPSSSSAPAAGPGGTSWPGARSSTGSCGCRARSTCTSSRTSRRRRTTATAPCPGSGAVRPRSRPAAAPPGGLLAGARAARCSRAVLVPAARRRRPADACCCSTCCVVVAVAAVGGARARRSPPRVGGFLLRQLVLHPAAPHAGRSPRPRTCSPSSSSCVAAGVVSVPRRPSPPAARPRRPGPRPRPRRWPRWPGTLADGRPAARRCVDHLRRDLRAGRRRAAAPDGGRLARSRPPPATGARRRPTTPTHVTAARRATSCCAVRGGDLAAEDRRVLNAFAAQLGGGPRAPPARTPQAARAAALAEANELRSALLQAVSHDLRTPLAGDQGVGQQPPPARRRLVADADRDEFLATIEEETDRLDRARRRTCST